MLSLIVIQTIADEQQHKYQTKKYSLIKANKVLEGDFKKGRANMSAMLPLMRILEQGGKFVQCIKYGLTLRGIDAGPPRKPLQPLNKDDKRELAEVIRTMNTAISSIKGANT